VLWGNGLNIVTKIALLYSETCLNGHRLGLTITVITQRLSLETCCCFTGLYLEMVCTYLNGVNISYFLFHLLFFVTIDKEILYLQNKKNNLTLTFNFQVIWRGFLKKVYITFVFTFVTCWCIFNNQNNTSNLNGDIVLNWFTYFTM